MLWRCWAQGHGGLKTGTLLEDELARILFAPGGIGVEGISNGKLVEG